MDTFEAKAAAMMPQDEPDWNVIRLMVEKYTERHPDEVVGAIEYVRTLRKGAKDAKFAETSEETSMRHLLELPSGLMAAIEFKYPKALSGKHLRTFHGLYPVFFVPEKL